MKSPKQVEEIIGQARLRADRTTDERILSDAHAALEAGLTGVWLNRQREDESGADGLIVIHDLRELPPLLEKRK